MTARLLNSLVDSNELHGVSQSNEDLIVNYLVQSTNLLIINQGWSVIFHNTSVLHLSYYTFYWNNFSNSLCVKTNYLVSADQLDESFYESEIILL